MKQLKFFLTVLLIAFVFSSLFAQENSDEDTLKGKGIKVTIFNKRTYRLLKHMKHPSVSIYSGFNNPTYSALSSTKDFNTQNFASISLGYTEIETHQSKTGTEYSIIENDGLFLENYSSKWKIQNNTNIDAKMWRFGIRFGDEGYGYRIGKNNYLFFTHSNTLNWSKFDVENLSSFVPPDSHLFNVFASQFRFGTSFNSGISLVLLNTLSLDLLYERSIIFPGHKFWYWAGSSLIEGVSMLLLNEFIESILKSNTAVAPVAYGILKGALSFGIYELRKDKMNWPFKTSPPLFNETFKFGIKFLL